MSVVDERRLVLFGLTHGIIRKQEKMLLFEKLTSSLLSPYVVGMSDISDNEIREEQLYRLRRKFAPLYEMFDGTHTYDEICLTHDMTHAELDEVVERDPDILIIWK